MNAKNTGNGGCPQRDRAEHEGNVEARRLFNHIWKERDSAQSDKNENKEDEYPRNKRREAMIGE